MSAASGVSLLLDYDGTLAEITDDPSLAFPLPGVRELLDRIAGAEGTTVTIVTGRLIADVRRLLPLRSSIQFSGLHGMEFTDRDGQTKFIDTALACAPELASIRRWLKRNIPPRRGFWIEDKIVALGMHYRNADPARAARLCARFTQFVTRETPSLKLLPLKMLMEAMPSVASKELAVKRIKQRTPRDFVTVYFGDDITDEAAFAALDRDDVGVLVGPARESFARYRVPGPRAVVRELRSIATVCAGRSMIESV